MYKLPTVDADEAERCESDASLFAGCTIAVGFGNSRLATAPGAIEVTIAELDEGDTS